jgi:hypothetical protein
MVQAKNNHRWRQAERAAKMGNELTVMRATRRSKRIQEQH